MMSIGRDDVKDREAQADGHPSDDVVELVPASSGQRRLWLLNGLLSDRASYNLPILLRLEGPLDRAALEVALAHVIRRHDILRTTFIEEGDDLQQVIAPTLRVPLAVQDLHTGDVVAAASRDMAQPFDLRHGPLLRATLYVLGERDHVLGLCFHHAIFDGWSDAIFVKDLAACYNAARAGAPVVLDELDLQYADYAMWQREYVASERMASGLAYWAETLAGVPPALVLPIDRPRPMVASDRGGVAYARWAAVVPQLAAFNRKQGASLFMTILAAFQVVLHRYSQQDDFVVGSAMAGRSRPELEGLIGFFVNTVALRARIDPAMDFASLLARVKQAALSAHTHQDVPFEAVVQAVHPQRAGSRVPLVQALLVVQNAASAHAEFDGLQTSRLPSHNGTSKCDLLLSVSETGDALELMLEFDSDIFDRETAQRLLDSLRLVVDAAIADPSVAVSRLPIVSAVDRRTLLETFNATAADFPATVPVHQQVLARAAEAPSRPAVVFEDRTLTYDQLAAQMTALAAELRARGVRPGVRVALFVERSIEMVVGVLGILQAGGAYVPLDPAYPDARLQFMLSDGAAPIAVTQRSLAARLPESCQRVFVEEIGGVAGAAAASAQASDVESLAYVIYTSGSTGKPKGVGVTHRNLSNLLVSIAREPGFTSADTLLAVTTLSFDVATAELLLPLVSGGTVVVASREVASDGVRLRTLIDQVKPTLMHPTPVTWRLLLDAGWPDAPQLTVGSTGEALPRDLAEHLLARVEQGQAKELWNLYGPTETTIWSTIHRVASGPGVVPIGKPIANTQTYVLDTEMQPVPIGVRGELYIGGEGVAPGYLDRPDLTQARFVPDPFRQDPGARLYRTGDAARYLVDGTIECLERLDHQVKLRGFRIELGEIEAALSAQSGVGEAVVILREDTPGERRLVAYVTPSTAANGQVLRNALRARLPEYMVPAFVVPLDALPRTQSGKIDRKALPAPVDDAGARAPERARTATEETLAKIFCDVLKRGAIGLDSDFFDYGGHSLLVTSVLSRVREAFGLDVVLRDFFSTPTVEGLARIIEARAAEGRSKAASPIGRRARRSVSEPGGDHAGRS